jgi:hypothetical protein
MDQSIQSTKFLALGIYLQAMTPKDICFPSCGFNYTERSSKIGISAAPNPESFRVSSNPIFESRSL